MAWEHGGADFQSRFDKSTVQAIEMKKGGAARSVTIAFTFRHDGQCSRILPARRSPSND
jgi:hypothetical protein